MRLWETKSMEDLEWLREHDAIRVGYLDNYLA